MKKYILVAFILLIQQNVFAQEQVSNLVVPVSYFINHVSQLNKIKDNLNKYKQSSIVGISGMGKTQLARMYAYENKNEYDIIWFIDCNLDIDGQLLKLVKSINKALNSPEISDNPALVRKELMSYLASKDKWLLVFDNLKVGENKKVEDFITWEHNGSIIFSSQDSELLNHIIKVNALTKNETELLAQSILDNKNPELIEFLTQEFQGYPILIVQGIQILNQIQGLNFEEYKKEIKASDDKLELNIKLAMDELKPSAKRLLGEIALVNNQGFSKELLNSITSNKDSLDNDIYQLSKFALIYNIISDETNPVFEMHDIIAEKVLQINGNKNNKEYIEQVANNFINSVPKSVVKGRIFRNSRTIQNNLEIITENAEKYDISIYKILGLKINLIVQYVNSADLHNTRKLVEWFDKNDQENNFRLWMMNNDEKTKYAAYLGIIGGYYKNCAEHHEAIKYDIRAKKAFDEVKGYESYKCNVIYGLTISLVELGKLQEAEENIKIMEDMFNQNLVDKADIATLYFAKAKLLLAQGKFDEALNQINNSINTCIENGMKSQDLYLTSRYISKTEILNNLAKYQEAYAQVKQIYDMNKPTKKEDNSVFGYIFTEMSRAELGLGKAKEALEHAQKAKAIFINDPTRPNENLNVSRDTGLAKAFAAEGDALTALKKNQEAVNSYGIADVIYYNNYGNNTKNIDEVSVMYLKAAKASCHLPNKLWYKKFGNQHIEEFGENHPRSVEIFKLKCQN